MWQAWLPASWLRARALCPGSSGMMSVPAGPRCAALATANAADRGGRSGSGSGAGEARGAASARSTSSMTLSSAGRAAASETRKHRLRMRLGAAAAPMPCRTALAAGENRGAHLLDFVSNHPKRDRAVCTPRLQSGIDCPKLSGPPRGGSPVETLLATCYLGP